MTITVTLNNVADLTNTTTAETTINNNSSAIVTGFTDALNIAGDTMNGNLNMNSNRIYNLPTPGSNTDPVRLGDLGSSLVVSTSAYTVATLPGSPTKGQVAYVTDGTSGLSWGATVTGGHSTIYLVWYNGSNWTVLGK